VWRAPTEIGVISCPAVNTNLWAGLHKSI
jgi:hypothetical protein